MKKHLPWFKHYCNAHEGESLTALREARGLAAVGFYWLLLELIGRWENRAKEPGKITVHIRTLRQLTNSRNPVLIDYLSIMGRLSLIAYSMDNDGLIDLSACKWPEFQETRGQKKNQKKHKDPGEERGEKKEERVEIENEDCESNDSVPSLLELWNTNCGVMRKAERLTPKRQTAWRRMWKENADPGYWARLIRLAALTPFCTGKNERKWLGDIDWFIRPQTHAKLLEGAYGPPHATEASTDALFEN